MDNEILIAYTRASVPTCEHVNFINEVQDIAQALRTPFKVFVNGIDSFGQGVKHLLTETRLDMFNGFPVEPTTQKTSSIFKILKEHQNYKNILVAVPHELSEIVHDALNRVNGKEYNFESINVIPTESNPDKIQVSSLHEVVHSILINSKSFDSLVEEFESSNSGDIRESYVSGSVFSQGDIVESIHTLLPMTVLECAANYLWVADHTGERKRCWLNEVFKVSSGSIYSFDDSFFGFIPESLNQDQEQQKLLSETIQNTNDLTKILESAKTSEVLAAEKVMQFERRRIALIFAKSVGVSDTVATIPNPEVVVEAALRKLNNIVLTKDGWKILGGMLALLKKIGIDYNENMLNANLRHNLGFIHETADLEHELDKLEQNPDILDKDIKLIADAKMLEDMEAEVLSEDETIEYLGFPENELTEAISAQERLKRSIRLRGRSKQYAAKRKLSMKRYASNAVVNRRARRAAISLIKNRITHGRKNLSVSEKIRIENMISKRPQLVNRVTQKLIPVVRKTAMKRLSETVDAIVTAKETVAHVLCEKFSSFVLDKEILEEAVHEVLDYIPYSVGDDVKLLEQKTIKQFTEILKGNV